MLLREAKKILKENGFLLEEEDPQKKLLKAFEAVCVNYPNNVAFGTEWADNKQQIYINIYSNGEINTIYIEPKDTFFETVGEIVDACEDWQVNSYNANKETGKFVKYLKALPQEIKDRG